MQLSIPPALIGTGTGMLVAARNTGAAVGSKFSTLFIQWSIFLNLNLPAAGAGAIYNSLVARNVPPAVASAALSAGLPASSVTAFVTALVGNNAKALASVAGVNADIIAAATLALKYAYAGAIKHIWGKWLYFVLFC